MDWQEGTCYLNGQWVPLANAQVSVLDRGFIFGDGVYEVIPVDTVDGIRAPFHAKPHYARLQRSLDAVRIANPLTLEQWLDLTAELVDRHPWPRQLIYVQVTRGVAKRDHPFPAGVAPTVFMNSTPWPEIPVGQIDNGVSAVTHADERWLHCDIKSISLLGNVLMKQYAMDNGASETVMLRDGFLTEGSSTNTMIVKNGVVIAPRKSVQILPGITYDAVFDIAQAHGLVAERRPVPEAELRGADEVWLSSSGREVLAITTLDGRPVGNGRPGPVYRQVQAWMQQAKRDEARAWKAARAGRQLAA
ncbi:MAG: D-amino acid aminotransferase [Burkholderiaceae bacterium]